MTNQEIINAGQTIYDETVEAANTSERVGSVIKGIGENLNGKDESIAAQAAQDGYYECTVSGTTLAVTAPGYKIPTNGGCVRIKMSAAGTGASTLNIGSTGAKQLLYNGIAVSSENTWEAGEIISVYYDPSANSNNGAYQASNARGGGGKAEKTKYDNTQSGLAATNVQDAIDEVEESLTDFVDVPFGTLLTGHINSNGAWTSSGGHYLIPVEEGQVYRLKTTSSGVYYAWLSGTETTGTPSYTDGATKSKKITSVDNYVYIKVPNSATHYLYLVHYISGTYYDPTSLQRKKNIKERLEEYDNINVENEAYPEDTTNDFVISDENGNDIVQFRNGHIKTRNFDSAQIDLSSIGIFKFIKNKYDGLRCAIVGDSISTYEGTMPSGYAVYYPHGDVTNVGSMWWKIVCNTFRMTPVNCAWSGSRVTGAPKGETAYAACSDQRILDMGRDGTPDIIIFFIGCNDWGNDVALCGNDWSIDNQVIDDSEYSSTDTLTLFCEAYSLMLYKTKKTYPHARIFCCTTLDEVRRDDVGAGIFPPINKSLANGGASNYTWNKHIKMIAEAYGCDVINMHDCGVNYFNLEQYYCVDASQGALHPNTAGHALMAQKVISELISK